MEIGYSILSSYTGSAKIIFIAITEKNGSTVGTGYVTMSLSHLLRIFQTEVFIVLCLEGLKVLLSVQILKPAQLYNCLTNPQKQKKRAWSP